MDRNDGTVADDTTDLHAVVVEIQFGRQQKVQHDTVVVEEVVEDTSDLFVDTVIQFCLQERIQHQVDLGRTDDDDTVAVQETDMSVEQVHDMVADVLPVEVVEEADMVAYVLPVEVVEETRYADDDPPVFVAVEEEFGRQQTIQHQVQTDGVVGVLAVVSVVKT